MERKFVCVTISEYHQKRFDDALSDALCWLNGYVAGGGTYSPQFETHRLPLITQFPLNLRKNNL